MLETLGVRSMNDLLVDIPQSLRLESLQLPNGLSEFETMAQVSSLAERNHVYPDRLTFRGGGIYRRFIPAAVSAVTSKPEFYTAYTPYQAEASQGTLQAIFEFQTLIAELTALDVSNASLYDGATAVAEAAMMAYVHTGRNEVLVSGYVHPEYVQVLRAFGEGRGIKVRKGAEPNKKTAAIIFQQPDFLGLLVDASQLTQAAHDVGALAIACWRRPASTAPTSRSAKGSSLVCRPASADRTSDSSRASASWCESCRDVWSAPRTTRMAGADSCSRWRPASSTSGARRRPPTSARTTRFAPWRRRYT